MTWVKGSKLGALVWVGEPFPEPHVLELVDHGLPPELVTPRLREQARARARAKSRPQVTDVASSPGDA